MSRFSFFLISRTLDRRRVLGLPRREDVLSTVHCVLWREGHHVRYLDCRHILEMENGMNTLHMQSRQSIKLRIFRPKCITDVMCFDFLFLAESEDRQWKTTNLSTLWLDPCRVRSLLHLELVLENNIKKPKNLGVDDSLPFRNCQFTTQLSEE